MTAANRSPFLFLLKLLQVENNLELLLFILSMNRYMRRPNRRKFSIAAVNAAPDYSNTSGDNGRLSDHPMITNDDSLCGRSLHLSTRQYARIFRYWS